MSGSTPGTPPLPSTGPNTLTTPPASNVTDGLMSAESSHASFEKGTSSTEEHAGVRVAVASAELERDDGEAKPLHAYYQHLLQYRNGQLSKPHRPWFLRLRSNDFFMTAVVCLGVTTDLFAYSIIVPVLPFRLQDQHYSNVASLMSWLLVAYSGGILVATFPVAFFFHRYPFRRGPLIIAVLIMEAAFVLFMLAEPYWCMIVSRIIQGMCSCVIWTVGLALICENIDASKWGLHLGIASSGLLIGATIAPPIGGSLYEHLGWHAPFIFCIILCGLDLVMRIMILERKDVMLYKARKGAYDEALAAGLENEAALQCQTRTLALGAEEMVPPWMTVAAAWSAREEKVKAKKEKAEKAKEKAKADKAKAKKDNKDKRHSKAESDGKPDTDMAEKEAEAETDPEAEFDTATDPGVDLQDRLANFHVPIREPPIELSAWHTLVTLASMPRGLVAFLLVFVFGFLVGAIDSTLAMRVSAIWNKDAKYVGIMYVIAAAPSFFGGPLAGHIADQVGAEWIVAPTLIYALPWVPLMTWHKDIAPFIVFYALGLLAIMILNSISSLEMAIVAKFKPGISEIHMFATMNLVFAVSSAVGAIVGGQIYGHVRNGWDVICWIGFAIFVVSIPPTLVYTGRRPLLSRILRIPEPRACLPPGEREAYDHTRRGGAAEDPEAAAANTQTGDNVTSNKSSN